MSEIQNELENEVIENHPEIDRARLEDINFLREFIRGNSLIDVTSILALIQYLSRQIDHTNK